MANRLTEAVNTELDRGRPDSDDEPGRETIDNRERGCGHLDPNACYVRCDLAALSHPNGEIPPFVELDDPVEYREHNGKGAIIPGFKAFPGNSFSLHYDADGNTTTPSEDITDHIERLHRHGFDGKHYGEITSSRSTDLLMSVGHTNYETPDEYIDECRERGLNLKIPVSDRQAPPVVEPLRTRVWVIHPHGCGEGRPGIIGYSYVTRNVFTTGTKATDDDPDIPRWASDYAAAGRFDVVDRGEPIAADDDETQATNAHETLDTFSEPFDSTDTVDSTDDTETLVEQAGGAIDAAADALTGDETVETPAQDDTGDSTDDADSDDRTGVETATIAVPGDDRDVTGIEIRFEPDVDREIRRETFEYAVHIAETVPYNGLKVVASQHNDVDVGSTPSTTDLLDALADAGAWIPAYRNRLDDETTDDSTDDE